MPDINHGCNTSVFLFRPYPGSGGWQAVSPTSQREQEYQSVRAFADRWSKSLSPEKQETFSIMLIFIPIGSAANLRPRFCIGEKLGLIYSRWLDSFGRCKSHVLCMSGKQTIFGPKVSRIGHLLFSGFRRYLRADRPFSNATFPNRRLYISKNETGRVFDLVTFVYNGLWDVFPINRQTNCQIFVRFGIMSRLRSRWLFASFPRKSDVVWRSAEGSSPEKFKFKIKLLWFEAGGLRDN